MDWENNYISPDPHLWEGDSSMPGEACFFQHIELIDLLKQKPLHRRSPTFAIVGFKCDEGVIRDKGIKGASLAPGIIRQQLASLSVQKKGIACYDAGDISCKKHSLETSQKALGELITLLNQQNICPLVIGGTHDAALGHYQGIANAYPNRRLGIINFDAHFDFSKPEKLHYSKASTTFYQIAEAHHAAKRHFDYNCIGIQHTGNIRQLFSAAKKANIKLILADELHQGLQEKSFDFIDRVIDENDIIHICLSMDVFSPAYAPGVNSIQPLGLNPWHIIPLLRQAAASGKVVGYDITDHIPKLDKDLRTAKLAAALLYEIIHHHKELSCRHSHHEV